MVIVIYARLHSAIHAYTRLYTPIHAYMHLYPTFRDMVWKNSALKIKGATMAKKMTAAQLEEKLYQICEIGTFDPLTWVRTIFPWGEKGTLLEHETGPDKWQVDVLEALRDGSLHAKRSTRIAVASGHGIGKTALTAWVILWFMSCRPHPGMRVTANTMNQLSVVTWRELAKWHKLMANKHWFEWTATKFYHKAHAETWFAPAVPWSENNSEAFAGLHENHVLVLFDEASGISDVIWEVVEGAMTTPGAFWLCFGNPTKNTGRFRECFSGGRFADRWKTMHVDSREAKKTNKEELKEWEETYGEDSDFFRVRVRGVFPRQGAMQFISGEMVREAVKRKVEVPRGAPKIMGVDVARYGDDESVIARRHGRRLEPLMTFRELDTMQLAAEVGKMINTYRPDITFVDDVGVGAGVVDRLLQLGYNVIGVNGGTSPEASNKAVYTNKRAEMWGRMRDWLASGEIPADVELMSQLVGPEYEYSNKMQIMLEKKESMKKRGLDSPDRADALALTFAFDVIPVKDDELYWEPDPVPAY